MISLTAPKPLSEKETKAWRGWVTSPSPQGPKASEQGCEGDSSVRGLGMFTSSEGTDCCPRKGTECLGSRGPARLWPPATPPTLSPSIQVRCGNSWGPVFGASGGTTQEFLLQPGEHIDTISGSHRVFIRFLFISTDWGRYAMFGRESGNTFLAGGNGKVLTGICGQHKILGLSGLCFRWDYPPEEEEEETTASPPTSTKCK